MLREPRTHVRQRSFAKADSTDDDPPADAPLLVERESYEEKTPPSPSRPSLSYIAIAALWASSLAATALLTFLVARSSGSSPLGSLEAGYVTELHNARSVIKLHKHQFQGSLDFKAHRGFIPSGSPSLQYIGSTPDVDAAWDDLTHDRYFLLSDAEAREAYGDDHLPRYWNEHHGGYAAGLDVLHTLHCLNHLRHSLYPRVYPQDPQNAITHNAHCIDHLRQLAMCHADLTPIPTQFFPGLGQNYINSSREHVCRDFDSVRAWATERFNGSTAVRARNRDGSPRDNFYGPWG